MINQKETLTALLSKELRSRKAYEWLIAFWYFSMIAIGTRFHEPWRDEWWAYAISYNFHSLGELQQLLSRDGHPFLWHLFLKPFSIVFSGHHAGLALAGMLSGAAGFILVFLLFQLPLWIRIGTLFSYYSIYEYAIVARPYGLAFTFTIVAVWLFQRGRRLLLSSIFLGLAASTHFLFALANIPLIIFIYKLASRDNLAKHRILISTALAIVFTILGMSFAASGFAKSYLFRQVTAKAARIERFIIHKTDHIQELENDRKTPALSRIPAESASAKSQATIVSLLMLYTPLALISIGLNSSVLWIYSYPSLLLVYSFQKIVYGHSIQHGGIYFTILVASLALSSDRNINWELNALRPFKVSPGIIERTIGYTALALLLIYLNFQGLSAWASDVRLPFSGSESAARYIVENKIPAKSMIFANHHIESRFAALLSDTNSKDLGVKNALVSMYDLNYSADLTTHQQTKIGDLCRIAAHIAQERQSEIVIIETKPMPIKCQAYKPKVLSFPGIREPVHLIMFKPSFAGMSTSAHSQ